MTLRRLRLPVCGRNRMGRVTHTDEPLTPFQSLEGPAEALTPGRVSLAPLAMSSARSLFRRYEHPILPFPHSPSLHLTHLTHPRVGFPSLFVPGAAAVKPPGLKRLRTQAIYSYYNLHIFLAYLTYSKHVLRMHNISSIYVNICKIS